MALGILQLGFTLLWVLKTQAQNSTDEEFSSPSLSKAPLQPNFQEDKFQGHWNVMGWAQNTLVNESISSLKMLSTTFYLNDDHSYNVTSIWFSEQGCTTQNHTLVPSGLPGQYTMLDVNATGIPGLQNFTMKVVEIQYNKFAMVFYQATIKNKDYMECVLYDRNRKMNPDLMLYFMATAMTMGFKNQYIHFTIARDGCKLDYLD